MAITNYYLEDIGSETVTAIHEMGHMFGIKDHYAKDENDDKNLTTQQAINKFNDPSYNELCLYGEGGYGANSLGSVVICQGCRNRVEEWRNAHSN